MAENSILGPNLSTNIPTIILAGIVIATLRMSNTFACTLKNELVWIIFNQN
jgi:hypothetical protein